MKKQAQITVFLLFTLVVGYSFVAYFLERTHFYQLIFIWFFLFIVTFLLIKKQQQNIGFLIAISVLFRLIFLVSIPNLSQDFYRFIWDGRMILNGFNPYLSLPQSFIENRHFPIPQALNLYAGMGDFNGSHYTNYPPINQLCFFIAALFAKKSILGGVIVMRFLIIFADVGIFYFGKKLLQKLDLPVQNIFLYLLNPFIIIELTGNLHFESVMLFFLVWSLYLLSQKKWVGAAILLALSVSVKLIPLLFLPLFYQWFVKTQKKHGFLKLIAFYSIIFVTIILLFLPFYSSEFITNYTKSVGLWFKTFEFNASVYYLFRAIGYQFRGWNEIAIIGKIMPTLSLLFLIGITFFRKNTSLQQLITALLFGLSFYYFTSTTVHPWYIASLVLLGVFTRYRFPIIWSFVIVFSYQAYANTPWKEHLLWVFFEYLVVYGILFWEILSKKESFNKKKNFLIF